MHDKIPKESEAIIPILSRFKDLAQQTYGNRLKKIVLYGSYARGVALPDSDIDMMIVLSEMNSAFSEIERLSEVTFNLNLEYGVHISANPVSDDSFSHSTLPFFKNVSAEGIEI